MLWSQARREAHWDAVRSFYGKDGTREQWLDNLNVCLSKEAEGRTHVTLNRDEDRGVELTIGEVEQLRDALTKPWWPPAPDSSYASLDARRNPETRRASPCPRRTSSHADVSASPNWPPDRMAHRTGVAVERDLLGFVAGFVIATITSPVGVSGAVFLLPVQLSVFAVPNPQVTPTNLLYNVLSGPGALVRYARQGQLRGPLARSLVLGSAPGVIIGAVLRVYVADDPTVFKLVAAAVLAPTGLFILLSTRRSGTRLTRAHLEPEDDHPGRVRRGDRGRHLRDRGWVDPRTDPRRLWHGRQRGCPSRARKHVRHVHRRSRHLRAPAAQRGGVHRPGLVTRRRVRPRWVVGATSVRPSNPGCPRSCCGRSSVFWPSDWQCSTRFRRNLNALTCRCQGRSLDERARPGLMAEWFCLVCAH